MVHRGVFICALLAASATAALAQQGPPRGIPDSTMIEQRVTTMTDRLELTAEQSAQLRVILNDEAAKARQAMAAGDREAMREAFRERIKETDRRIEEILTDTQKKAYQEYREERRQEMRKRFEGRERPKQ